MGTKENLLSLLEKNKGIYLSGEEIAEALSVSRTAVWKAVNSLRSRGYPIDAATNKGYCLSPNTDILSAEGIEKYLDGAWRNLSLEVLSSTDSTNAMLRKQADAGAPEGTVLLANCQTKGRGRLGRSFFSPADTGVYLSLLLRPQDCPPQQAVRLTTMAAVAACDAIEAVCGAQAGIKWVNDIFLDGKKVCGILTEASVSLENGSLEYAVLGAGFNVYPPAEGFPEELETVAGTLFPTPRNDGKNLLAAAFLNRFLPLYHAGDQSDYVRRYREKSIVLGRKILLETSGGREEATVLDIDSQCRLVVQYPDGRIKSLSSGEIRICPQ